MTRRGWICCPVCGRRVIRLDHPYRLRHPSLAKYVIDHGTLPGVLEIAEGAALLPGIPGDPADYLIGDIPSDPDDWQPVLVCPRLHNFRIYRDTR